MNNNNMNFQANIKKFYIDIKEENDKNITQIMNIIKDMDPI